MRLLIPSPLPDRLGQTLSLIRISAACVPVMPDAAPPPLAALSQRGGTALHVLVGHPAATLPDKGGWGALRVIRPGMRVTMDYSATRLNVHIDGADMVLAHECG